jgi:ABC-type multidrug transport system fused ATPase/permease subunit
VGLHAAFLNSLVARAEAPPESGLGITAGDLTLIGAQAMLLINRTLQLADKLPEIIEHFGNAQESLNTLIHPSPQRKKFPALQLEQPSVEFEDVHFGYGPEAVVFNGLNLHIKPGEKIGLVGPSGSGKSTLVGLLMRLYEIQGGQIRVGGHDVQKVDVESLRGCMAFIPQDTSLFHRTVAENIRYSRPDATDEEIVTAAKAAQADEFIQRLSKSYGTTVGERGVKLSGGQRQRVAIARALVKGAPILLLDEATSALDSESEQAIQAAIKKAMEGRTVIAIAHRLSTLADMDRVIVLEHGKIVEDGPHHVLLAQGGLYARLWQHQSGGFLSEHVRI